MRVSSYFFGPIVATAALAVLGATKANAQVAFTDVSLPSGVESFQHFSYGFGGDGLSGAAWFDYNEDGFLDLYIPNGKDITSANRDGFANALFENQGDGTFVDVAVDKGVTNRFGNAAVIAADIDNDGDQDIFLTGDGGMLGHDVVSGVQTIDSGVTLYINNGPPAYDFTRANNTAVGLTGLQTTMSAAFADIDSDGLLDLYIAAPGTRPEGCIVPPPCDQNDPTTQLHVSRLYLNRTEDGIVSFKDITLASSIGESLSGALAAAFSDYNKDGKPDLLVANGVTIGNQPHEMQLYHNVGYFEAPDTQRFRDISEQVGFGVSSAWMSMSPADFDGDGNVDLFVTNVGGSAPAAHALMHWSTANRRYTNVSAGVGIYAPGGSPSDYFGWGSTAQDFDLDGRIDLFWVGAPPPLESTERWNPGTLLINQAGGTFEDRSDATGVDLSGRYTSGVAAADYDNDGRVDIAVVTDNYNGDLGKPVLLHNDTQHSNDWITLRLTGNGTTTNHDAVGARIFVSYGAAPTPIRQFREVYAGTGFLSMDSKWITVGLAQLLPNERVRVRVEWPDGPDNANAYTSHGPFLPNQIVDIVQP